MCVFLLLHALIPFTDIYRTLSESGICGLCTSTDLSLTFSPRYSCIPPHMKDVPKEGKPNER